MTVCTQSFVEVGSCKDYAHMVAITCRESGAKLSLGRGC